MLKKVLSNKQTWILLFWQTIIYLRYSISASLTVEERVREVCVAVETALGWAVRVSRGKVLGEDAIQVTRKQQTLSENLSHSYLTP